MELSPAESPPRNISKWERFACKYRVTEFAISIFMYGFAFFFAMIQVAQRTDQVEISVEFALFLSVFNTLFGIMYYRWDPEHWGAAEFDDVHMGSRSDD